MFRFRMQAIIAALTILMLGVGSTLLPSADAVPASSLFTINVCCDANSFVFEGPSGASGPEYGASFVVQGWIYPAGTLQEQGFGSGLLAGGEPEFPELVMGQWTCRGWFIGDGLATASGPFVVTSQIYEFDSPAGGSMLISEGFELIDSNVPFVRALTGGTGRFMHVDGQVTQTSVGTNATGLFNFTFDFEI